MKYSIVVTIFLFFTQITFSQHLVQGEVLDEDKAPLAGATVVLLEPVDSSMIAFAIADNNGRFTIEDVEEGDYILQLSFVSFKTSFSEVSVKGAEKKVQIGSFSLETSSEILQEVTVKAEHIPMGIIGDTISYNAAAFNVKPGASVEDLLKKLPGIEVQRDGSIKAMGENVENVLVDGKEFFGNDPKIATKNLDAEAVDKVQVFDKQSDIAEFTGIEDGDEEVTINLKLKEGYKAGGFGNAEMAGGTESTYKGKVNYNRFSPKMQAALIVGANNVNEQAFSFNEYIGFMGGLANAISGTNGFMNFGEFGQGSTPQGITDNISTGLNFNYDFSSKLKLTSNYFYLRSDQNLNRQTLSNQFTPTENFTTQDSSLSDRLNQNHRLNLKLDYKPGKLSQLLWKNNVSGILNDNSSNAQTIYSQKNKTTGLTTSNLLSINDQIGYESSLIYRRKYIKKGRNWINTAKFQYGQLEQADNVINEYLFGTDQSFLNQFQDYRYKKNNLSLTSTYTEPIGKTLYLSGSYKFDKETETPDKKFFDIANGENNFNQDLSRLYEKNNTIHEARLSLKKNTKKTKLNIGMGWQRSDITGFVRDDSNNQVDELNNQSSFILPSISIDHDLPNDKGIELSYRTYVTLPTLNQLAPLPDNSNPNLFILGNPNLSPSYTHSIALNFRMIDQFNFKNFFLNANLNIIKDRVINEVALDDQFLRTIKPVNTDLFKSLNGYASYSAPIRPLKIKFNASTNFTWSKYKSSLNDQISEVNESNANIKLTIDNRNKDHVDIATGIDLNYNTRKYDINSDFDQQFFNYSLFIDGIFHLSKSLSLSSKYDHVSYSGEFFSASQKFNLWGASIRKSFNEERVAITLSINDILNQNRGLERSGGLNALYETRFNTRARYVMLGAKVKLGKRKDDAVIKL